jgi:hypothetical protein
MGNAKNLPHAEPPDYPPWLVLLESPEKSILQESGAFPWNQEFSFFPPPFARCLNR